MIFRPARGFVCMRCGEFNEIHDDSVGACDCEREAERREREQFDWRMTVINRWRARHVMVRHRRKRLRAMQEAM
jgi:hypothetical protein